MGKYKMEDMLDIDDKSISHYELFFTAIANELAEANRLKRLELNFLFCKQEIITTPINSEKFGKEISEDLA
jgi:hypothetical protein